jgi:hypothetical protein
LVQSEFLTVCETIARRKPNALGLIDMRTGFAKQLYLLADDVASLMALRDERPQPELVSRRPVEWSALILQARINLMRLKADSEARDARADVDHVMAYRDATSIRE